MHLKELKDEWLPTYKLEVRANTYSNAESRLRRVMRDIKPDTLIEKITPNYLTNYFNNLLYKQNLKNGTVSHIKQTLNVMFDYAVVHDYLKENPIQKVKIRYRKEDGSAKPRDKFLEDDELKKFLNLNIRPVTHMVDFVNSYISLVYDMAKLPL
ncbi:phage integrase SAM-like domain-containing protein [Limosilactobacillus reuteri]|nr:phage integrase SAM-like domain-containing protein [Limosilactobacillus reuteri]